MGVQAVWIDGEMAQPADGHLRADDHGLTVGDGIFETLLVINHDGRPAAFAVDRHLKRLRRSAAAMGLDCARDDAEIREAIGQCLQVAPSAGIIRVMVTSGAGPLGSGRGAGPGSTIVLVGDSPPAYQPGTGVAVMAHPRNERGMLAGVKTTSYAENVLALAEARRQGATEAIFVDTRGFVSEGTGSNIFWVADGALHTPPLDTGCLAGVTRELVIDHLAVTETHLLGSELESVQEAFLTSTTRAVQSIGSVNGTPLATVDGPLTQKAAALMANLMSHHIDP